MKYTRVLPRDLFNEAKLLKCIGRLVLKIHDSQAPAGLTFDYDGEAFNTTLLPLEGALMVTNVTFFKNWRELYFHSPYNARSEYPLVLWHELTEWRVFEESGDFTEDFVNIISTI